MFDVSLGVKAAHYPIYIMAGLLPWNAFQGAALFACGSVVGNAGLVKKVRFPLPVLPLSSVGFASVHFVLQLAVLFAVMAAAGIPVIGWPLVLPVPAVAVLPPVAPAVGVPLSVRHA